MAPRPSRIHRSGPILPPRWLAACAGWAALALLGLPTGCDLDDAADPTPLPAWARLDPAAAAGAPDRLALVLVSDWSSGGLSVIDLQTRATRPLVALTHADAVARTAGGRVFVVNRLGQDNLQLLDAAYSTTAQFSLGQGSNPQDVLLLPGGGEALVSRYAGDPLLLSLADGARRTPLDLSPWWGDDGNAECGYLAGSEQRVLLALQGLDHFRPEAGTSRILSWQPPDGPLVAHPTTAQNPYTPLLPDPCTPGGFVVGMSGRFGVLDGGLERIAADGSSAGLLIDEASLGGDVLSFGLSPDGRAGFALVGVAGADAGSAETRLVRFAGCATPAAEAGPARTLLAPGGWSLGWVAVNDRGEAWVSDRQPTAPGVRVFDAEGAELTAAPLEVGLPPFQILFAP